MKPLVLEVKYTADALRRAESDFRELVRIACEEHERKWWVRLAGIVGIALSFVGLAFCLLILLVVAIAPFRAGEKLTDYWALVFIALSFVALATVMIARRWLLRRNLMALMKFSLRRLQRLAPYTARYQLDVGYLETHIDELKFNRRRPTNSIAYVYAGEHALLVRAKGNLSGTAVIIPATAQQRIDFEEYFRASGVELISPPPKFMPQMEKIP